MLFTKVQFLYITLKSSDKRTIDSNEEKDQAKEMKVFLIEIESFILRKGQEWIN